MNTHGREKIDFDLHMKFVTNYTFSEKMIYYQKQNKKTTQEHRAKYLIAIPLH